LHVDPGERLQPVPASRNFPKAVLRPAGKVTSMQGSRMGVAGIPELCRWPRGWNTHHREPPIAARCITGDPGPPMPPLDFQRAAGPPKWNRRPSSAGITLLSVMIEPARQAAARLGWRLGKPLYNGYAASEVR
jgi:hypothetical protein